MELIWAIYRLGVEAYWHIPKGEHTLTFKPSGQQILFRGMDNPDSITSITVKDGYLCWVWWEEAYQCQNEQDFDKVDLSIRGDLPEPLFKQHTLIFNPWSEKTWIKHRFFDVKQKNVETFTTNYLCNEFLGKDDIETFDIMKEINPRRYEIEGLGNWGIAEGLIFTNWKIWDEKEPALNDLLAMSEHYRHFNGLDFGYTHPTAFSAALNKRNEFKLYVYDEFYESTMSNQKIANSIISKGFRNERITADSEDRRTINELKLLGLYGIKGAVKGPGSVLAGIQKLQDYQMIVHPRCQNFMIELNNYVWKVDPKTGKTMNEPNKEFDHLMDANRYGTEKLTKIGAKIG